MTFDCVAFGAHPDDCELFTGGLLAKLIANGAKVGIIHLTSGERATRGTAEERRIEAQQAAQALGLPPDQMLILDLGDTQLENNETNRLQIIRVLRDWRPRLILGHHPQDRHPDHRKASLLLEDAAFYSGLRKIETGQQPHRPALRLEFFNNSAPDKAPSCIVNITEHFETKMKAIRCYASQFHNPNYQGEETYISSPQYLEQIEIRARYFGEQIAVRYGEPLQSTNPLSINNPLDLLQ